MIGVWLKYLRVLYIFFPKRHTAVDVYAEAKEGGPDRPQHPGNRAVPLQKIVLDRLSKENRTPSTSI